MLLAESWARMYIGEMREALPLLGRARELVEDTVFSDVDRAEVLFRLGCCRYRLTSVSTALALFTEALELAERSGIPATGSGRASSGGGRAATGGNGTGRPRGRTSSGRWSSPRRWTTRARRPTRTSWGRS